MLKKVITSIIRKIIFLGIALGALIFIGYLASDRKDYPGKSQFEEANSKITTRSEGLAHGDSPESRAAAEAFATSMKTMQATLFTGGSGRSFASGGDFLTYVKRTPAGVVILCHVPELRNYKGEETRNALAEIAWASGQAAAAKLPGIRGSDTLIIGLRGFGSYGPIWEGTVSGEAVKKTDDLDEKRRFYPFFVEPKEV